MHAEGVSCTTTNLFRVWVYLRLPWRGGLCFARIVSRVGFHVDLLSKPRNEGTMPGMLSVLRLDEWSEHAETEWNCLFDIEASIELEFDTGKARSPSGRFCYGNISLGTRHESAAGLLCDQDGKDVRYCQVVLAVFELRRFVES